MKASFLAREHKDREKNYLVGLERSLQKLWLWNMRMPGEGTANKNIPKRLVDTESVKIQLS